MQFNGNRLGHDGRPGRGIQLPGFLAKALAFAATIVVVGVAFMFSIVLFAVAITAGLIAWAYLWWKMRGLRREMERQTFDGDVIEGEVIREVRDPGNSPGRD